MSLPWWLSRMVWVVEHKVGNNWVAADAFITRAEARLTSRYFRLADKKARVRKYVPKPGQ